MSNVDHNFTCSLVISFIFAIHFGESLLLRCYCNLPSCIKSAYMCKSKIGCFEDFEPSSWKNSNQNGVWRGCLELKAEKPYKCVTEFTLETVGKSATDGHRSLSSGEKAAALLEQLSTAAVVRCCKEDMCNYFSYSDIQNQHLQSDSIFSESDDAIVDDRQNGSETFWFQIAIIAISLAVSCMFIIFLIVGYYISKTGAFKLAHRTSDWKARLLSIADQRPRFSLNNSSLHKFNLNTLLFVEPNQPVKSESARTVLVSPVSLFSTEDTVTKNGEKLPVINFDVDVDDSQVGSDFILLRGRFKIPSTKLRIRRSIIDLRQVPSVNSVITLNQG
ncbi:BMP and activin membrane-bound inhibitor -like protein [Trichinella nativa]|uniref:BMP and activin membrane-bound inhibitor-like protein n=1 Tax=Trichinella nativa TaxID=6335 RepID=A0A0V1LG48_9BILA|nr:BMP and activin membrane-bound inhibitor -like protein [Trichinella nativa]